MDESMWSRRRVPWRRVRCNECDISTDWVCKGASPSEIERWNRRAELEARKNARIHELEMQALDLASENSILKRAEEAELEARKPLSGLDAMRMGLEVARECRGHATGTTNWATAMTRAYERRLCGITGGSS